MLYEFHKIPHTHCTGGLVVRRRLLQVNFDRVIERLEVQMTRYFRNLDTNIAI